MSRPKIPKREQEEAIIDAIESMALEEAALAHLVNAEAEKLQAVVEKGHFKSAKKLVKLQESILKVLRTVTKSQMLLQFKLEDLKQLKEKEMFAHKKDFSQYGSRDDEKEEED